MLYFLSCARNLHGKFQLHHSVLRRAVRYVNHSQSCLFSMPNLGRSLLFQYFQPRLVTGPRFADVIFLHSQFLRQRQSHSVAVGQVQRCFFNCDLRKQVPNYISSLHAGTGTCFRCYDQSKILEGCCLMSDHILLASGLGVC